MKCRLAGYVLLLSACDLYRQQLFQSGFQYKQILPTCVMKFINSACWINKVIEVWSEDRQNKVGIDSLKEKIEVKGNCIDLPLH